MCKMKKTKNRRLNFDVILYIAHLSIFITIYTFNTYGVGNQQRNHQGHRRCFRQYAEDSVLSPRSSYDLIDLAAMYIGDDGFNRVKNNRIAGNIRELNLSTYQLIQRTTNSVMFLAHC